MKFIIAGQECNGCKYSLVFEDDNGRLKAYCELRDKEYYYGARIPCEDKVKDDRTEDV